jgi:sortase A
MPSERGSRYAKLVGVLRRGRARLAVLPALTVISAIVLAANACGTVKTVSTLPRPLTAPPTLPMPKQLPLPAETAVQPTPTPAVAEAVPLPEPVVIPQSSYAEEPIVELGTMEIPKIGLYHAIFQGVTLNNIDHGPSHWPGTALPGQQGNTVFAGHRVTRTHPFRRLDELEPGDSVVFRTNGTRSTYRVTSSLVVEPEAVWIADQTTESTGTLYACHPPGSAAYRYVVKLALVSTTPDR